jgi:hypothetical protein
VVIVALLSPDVFQQKEASVPKRTEEVNGGGKGAERNDAGPLLITIAVTDVQRVPQPS